MENVYGKRAGPSISTCSVFVHCSGRDQRQHLEGDIGGEQSGDLSLIVGRQHLDDIEGHKIPAAQAAQ